MKNLSLIILSVLILYSTAAFPACSDPNPGDIPELFIAKLFPNSCKKVFKKVLGKDSSATVFVNISLRNQNAFIPLSHSRFLKLDDTLGVLSFEAYLFNDISRTDAFVQSVPAYEPDQKKLLQLLFFNYKTFKLFSKPTGFPLEASSWTCTGDMCDIINLISLKKVTNSKSSCALYANTSVKNEFLQIFDYSNGLIVISERFEIGDIGGESGNTINVNFTNIRKENNSILADKKAICEGDSEICESTGLKPGQSVTKTVLLNLNSVK